MSMLSLVCRDSSPSLPPPPEPRRGVSTMGHLRNLLTCYKVGITSRNAGSVRTRTVGSALYNMCVQASNIISSNVSLVP